MTWRDPVTARLHAAVELLRAGDRTAPYELSGEQTDALADLLAVVGSEDRFPLYRWQERVDGAAEAFADTLGVTT